MSLQLMKERIKQSGTSLYDEQIKDAQDILAYDFQNDVSCAKHIFFWIPGENPQKGRHVYIKFYDRKYSSANGNTKLFLTHNNDKIEVGDYIYDEEENTYWICTDEITSDINKRLNYSKIEQQMTEFKIGISDFSSSEINMDCIHRIARTLVAMANTNNGRDKEGFIIIGVANSRESYISWYNEYKEYANISNQHYIPGITCEASKLFHQTATNNSDEYLKIIRKLLSVEPISNKLKDYVLENLDIIDYYDIELVLIRSKNVGEVSLYDGIKWVRQGNETIKI